jgi:hypothetical protein
MDAHSAVALWSMSEWLRNGPKIARVSIDQFRALQHTEVRLPVHDFSSPFPQVLVEMPPMGCATWAVLINHLPQHGVLALNVICSDHNNDVVTCVRDQGDGEDIETYLVTFDDSVETDLQKVASACTRVAVNYCLAMANYGCQAELIFPKEVERDRRLCNRRDDTGKSARERVRQAPKLLTLERTVRLYHHEGGGATPGAGKGGEKGFHWRRGHWAMQRHGPGGTLRKRILRPAVMVRADLLAGHGPDETTTTYQ